MDERVGPESGEEEAEEAVDLSTMTYEDWLRFVFDHPADANESPLSAWYYADDVSFTFWSAEPARAVAHLTRLFREFADIGRRYSIWQVAQGIDLLIGSRTEFHENIWEECVPLAERVACVRAMYHVYADFVAISDEPIMPHCFDMWWDRLASSFWSGVRTGGGVPSDAIDPERLFDVVSRFGAALEGWQPDQSPQEHLRSRGFDPAELNPFPDLPDPTEPRTDDECATHDAMFETLVAILRLPDQRTQGYALHGLGHLKHPGGPAVVQGYIDAHREELTPEGLAWVEKCRDGTVM
jgi:hypothetical protein